MAEDECAPLFWHRTLRSISTVYPAPSTPPGMLDGSKCHNPTEASTSEAEIVLAQCKKEASGDAGLFFALVVEFLIWSF